MNARRSWILAIAAAAVLIAAIDTYVIVLALPAIMTDVGIGIDQLQAATPIISGFLLGYVVVMPMLGRLSDVYGRRPLLLLCLAVFAAGSLVTASAHDLGSVVAGRALQGLGGRWPGAGDARHWSPTSGPRIDAGVPLGVIGGVQELGSVLGPLYGGLILTVATLADDLLAQPADRGGPRNRTRSSPAGEPAHRNARTRTRRKSTRSPSRSRSWRSLQGASPSSPPTHCATATRSASRTARSAASSG